MKKRSRIRHRSQMSAIGYDDVYDPTMRHFNWPGSEFHRDDWTPEMTLDETEDAVLIKAEIPGVDPDDIEITIQDSVLTISGENRQSPPDDREDYYHIKRRYRKFRGSVELPHRFDSCSADATCHGGVLSIDLKKIDRTRTRHIPVKA